MLKRRIFPSLPLLCCYILCGFVLGVSLIGCQAMPIYNLKDTRGLEVRIQSILPATFSPGSSSRFLLALVNRTSSSITFERLVVQLQAHPQGHSNIQSVSGHWTYPMPNPITLKAGKEFKIPLTPEPHEFQMGGLLPGKYGVVAIVFDRFSSKPYLVRVDRPDLKRRIK